VLRLGLTGGIGSGKSTAARRLVQRGAVLVDADVLAREVVEPGSAGLAEVVAEFGDRVLDADGALDRPALAAVVFGDDAARARLNRIVHPRVRQRTAELMAAAPPDAVLVQDIPLLVEGRMAAAFALVVVVHAEVEERVRRLVELRGMPVADARARIAVQASDADRRAVADVWLDNSAGPAELVAAVDALWDGRLAPFADALRAGRPAEAAPVPVDPDPAWAAAGERLAARVAAAAGERGRGGGARRADRGARTARRGPGGPVARGGVAGRRRRAPRRGRPHGDGRDGGVRDGLRQVGFVPAGRGFRSADPGRVARVHVRAVGLGRPAGGAPAAGLAARRRRRPGRAPRRRRGWRVPAGVVGARRAPGAGLGERRRLDPGAAVSGPRAARPRPRGVAGSGRGVTG
jgi:dephospho-CoA kinase